MDYQCVTDTNQIKEYLHGANEIAFDFETAPTKDYRQIPFAALDPHRSEIVGISLSVKPASAIYIPLRHQRGKNANIPAVMKLLKERLFENSSVVKIAHNLSFETMFLYKEGIVPKAPLYDTIAAAQLSLKAEKEFRTLSDSGLKTLVPELLKVDLPKFEDVTQGQHFDELDPEEDTALHYACADSDYTLQLYQIFNDWFRKYLPRHEEVVRTLESPTAVFVGMMKYNGIAADTLLMCQKQLAAEEKLTELRNTINTIAGRELNIGANASTSEFKKFLYQEQELPVLKTTAKFKEAADDEALILLKNYCKKKKPELVLLLEAVQEYRKWSKLKSTYIDGILQFVHPVTGAIHADFFPLGTETGRFSSRKPNLQNCFDDQTEILTNEGWKFFSELPQGLLFAQWDNGLIEFVEPNDYVCYDYVGEMISIKNQHIDLCMTPDHRCLLQNRKNRQYMVVPASAYKEDYKQLHAGNYLFGERTLSKEEVIILSATQADGHYHDGGIEFRFEKARKYRRLIQAIKELDVPYSETVKSSGQVRIRLLKSNMTEKIMGLLGPKKKWGQWLLSYDRKTAAAITAEIMHWDGCFTRNNAYSSSVKENVDWMQILFVLTNTRAHFRTYQSGLPNTALNYQLDITDRNYSLTSNIEKTERLYKGKVYCCTVESGFIVVRRNGQVSITGNCPRKDSDPIGIRNFFCARDGHVLLDFDFSQIELRVGAYYCRDERMLKTYKTGGDIHAQTTAVIYNIPFQEALDKNATHYKERRSIAKNCNFGVFYGLFPRGLQHNLQFKAGLETTLTECEEIITNLKAGYPELTRWQNETKKRAGFQEYSETAFGRRRYLKGINSRDWSVKSYWERCALNTPIQGTAADILKMSMASIVAGLTTRPYIKPLLTIHDEIVFEVPEDKVEEAAAFIKHCMEKQVLKEFDVQIVAEGAVGLRFGELEELA